MNQPARPARLRAIGTAFLAVTLIATQPRAAESTPPASASERSVKAAYIYRFLPYVEWPAAVLAPGAPLVIGVIGADDVAAELEQVVRNRGDQRPIVVRRLAAHDVWTGTHVLFAGEEAAARVSAVAKALQDRSVLTVSDVDDAIDRGFVIGFVNVGSRLRFEVNTDVAERSGLKLSSRLLSVALRVRPGAR